MGAWKRLGNLTAALLVTLPLAGCTGGPQGPSVQDAAGELAAALSAGRLTTVAFSGGTPQQAQGLWTRAVDGLGDSKPRVQVGKVTEGADGKPSTATLSYVWRLAGNAQPWTYDTTAELTRGGDDAWQVRLDPSLVYPDLKQGESLRLTPVDPDRADITGAGGSRLVTERPVLRFGIDKGTVPAASAGASARRLARLVGVDPAAYAERVRAAGPKAFVEAIVLRPADAGSKRGAAGQIPGAAVVGDTLPLAPTREFARPILGSVGPVTAEIVKESDGAYRAGDEAGLSGLEARYDERLRGTPGADVEVVDAKGQGREVFSVDPQPGDPLATTLDPRLQRLAERVLGGVSPASALVAIRPSSGDVLAAASGPGGGGLSTATVGQYAPGSTFKVVTSLALLRSGLEPSSTMFCPETVVVDGKRFKNYDDYPADGTGRIPLSLAVANSCNTAFIGERETVDQPELARAAASLGLGVDHDLGFPAYFGKVPATLEEAGSETGHAASLIGQGRVTASPLAMATVAASVAKGSVVVPRLLPDQAADQAADGATPQTPLTAAEARQLRTLMRGVVTQGSGRFLLSVPGAPVLAKTGTAEFGSEEPLQTHAWMIAVHGDLAVAVFVDVGDSGSGTAGPLLDRFLRQAG
ncbi:penicillin-binding protein [Nocardioides panacis]|uniref:beta-lactamase n=1 Tax=Nocardioides panacis TaxID=2849501 RepID=A0A975T4A9_9ACTN|nr:penicillin-binding protein [Nocardioides panacis]